jgi:hypothetical protein
MVIVGHLIYGTVLLIAGLVIKNFDVKLWLYPLGLGFGHLLIFFPGILEVVREHERKSVVVFFIAFQLLLFAQDIYVLKIYGDPIAFGGTGLKQQRLLDAFFYVYIACEGAGSFLLLSCIYWIQFFDPSKIEKATLLKSFMVLGLILGIAGSVLYSLAWDIYIQYIGCGLIGVASIVYGFGFLAGRFNWLKPPSNTIDIRPNVDNKRREKEPLMKRIVPIKVPQPAPAPDRYNRLSP